MVTRHIYCFGMQVVFIKTVQMLSGPFANDCLNDENLFSGSPLINTD